MLNFCVANLDELLKNLKAEGVEIDPKREDLDYGPIRLDHGSRREPH